jgi:hypothetical protein
MSSSIYCTMSRISEREREKGKGRERDLTPIFYEDIAETR